MIAAWAGRMALGLLGRLCGTARGRRIAAALLIAAAVAWALCWARARGYAERRAEEQAQALRAMAERIKTDDDVAQMDARQRADALRGWLQ